MHLLTSRAGEVGKILGEKWKALSDKQRAPYEAKAANDKKRYEDEKAAYNAVRIPLPELLDAMLTSTGRRRRGRGIGVKLLHRQSSDVSSTPI